MASAHSLCSRRMHAISAAAIDAIAPQVTGGGVPLSELNLRTMHSKVLPGVFLCGEIVDVFGRIGGFNFYWAWVSGRLAGLSAAAPSKEDAAPVS